MVYRQRVLSLYKGKLNVILFRIIYIKSFLSELLKYGRTLELTDKQYFKERVKLEFVNNKQVEEKDIPYCMKQGRVFLLSRNVC